MVTQLYMGGQSAANSAPNLESDRINHLQLELLRALRTIIELMPGEIRALLNGYHDCKTANAVYAWQHSLVPRLLKFAKPQPARRMGARLSSTPRAYCPLCGGSSRLAEGYAFPKALRRHLLDSSNASQCKVIAAVIALCFLRIERYSALQECGQTTSSLDVTMNPASY